MYSAQILVDNPFYSEVFTPPINFMSSWIIRFTVNEQSVVIFLISFWIAWLILLKILVKDLFLTFLLGMSFPVLFTFGRGNQDYLIGLLLAIFLIFQNYRKYLISSIIIGTIIGLKFNYMYVLISFIKRKKYIYFLTATITAIILFILPILYRPENGTLLNQISVFSKILRNYTTGYAVYGGGSLHNNSFFGLQTIVMQQYLKWDGQNNLNQFNILLLDALNLHYLLSFLFICFILIKLVKLGMKFFVNLPVAEILFFLTLISIFITPVSAQYRFSIIVVLIAGLINCDSILIKDKLISLSISILIIPKTFWYWINPINSSYSTLDSVINPIIVLWVIIRIIKLWHRKNYKSGLL
jgi:hypothetical protein